MIDDNLIDSNLNTENKSHFSYALIIVITEAGATAVVTARL